MFVYDVHVQRNYDVMHVWYLLYSLSINCYHHCKVVGNNIKRNSNAAGDDRIIKGTNGWTIQVKK